MKIKKALNKYGGVVGKLATGDVKGAFPVISGAIDAFHSGHMDGVNDNDHDTNKRQTKKNPYKP